MSTWDIGPFDSDTAADFAGDLDEATMEEGESMIYRVLKRAADPARYLITPDVERAVAAAAPRTNQGGLAGPHFGAKPGQPEQGGGLSAGRAETQYRIGWWVGEYVRMEPAV
jgi:hypothetical protein